MKIELHRIDDAFRMQAVNESGETLEMDGTRDIGGSEKAMRPMQLVLAALGGCSSIDVIHLLRKMRQNLQDIRLTIQAERFEDQVPSLFKTIHVHYRLQGELDEAKVERAIRLSMEKYCSVAKILEKTATLSWSYEIEP